MSSRAHADYYPPRRYSRSRSRSPRRERRYERDDRYESDRYDRHDRYRRDSRDERDRGGRDRYYARDDHASNGDHYSSRDRGRYDDHNERRGGSRYERDNSSPYSERKRHFGHRENPPEGKRLAIFGLSHETKERDLFEFFGQWGEVEECQLVYDRQTGRSRGFGFINFKNKADAVAARGQAHERQLDGKTIRVDFSITERAHTPTPGVYLGRPGSSAQPNYSSPPPPSSGGRPYYRD